MTLAFFDFDRTLIAANSGKLWVKRELEGGHITHWQAMRALYWLGRYQLGLATMDRALAKAITHLEGHTERDLRERTARFYAREVKGLYRPGAHRALAFHRSSGHRIVLCTASSVYLAELVTSELGLDGMICNRFEVDASGRHTGRADGEICFGEGKLRSARTYAERNGIPLSDCVFYSDSYSDLPLLRAVGRPVAVNPDRRLARHAHRHGWEIADWGMPIAAPVEPEARSIAGS